MSCFCASLSLHHNYYNTPLIVATNENNFEVFKWLVDHGADINETCKTGDAPIHLALHHKDGKIAHYILKHKKFNPNVQRKEGKETPLMFAILFERQDIARKLLARTDLTLRDIEGLNVFDYLRLRSLSIDWLFHANITSKL